MADEITIIPTENGPNRIIGRFKLQWPSGHELTHKDDVLLCRCGHSKDKPFCDGSHVKVGFRSVEADDSAHHE